MNYNDPIFNLPKPVIFGHRGGAGEVPESTIESFLHTLQHGGNVIEVDVQLTQDEEIVVWHGPELDITFNEDGHDMKGQYVHCWNLTDLKELYVRNPDLCAENPKVKGDRNQIISLEQLVNFVHEVKDGKYGDQFKDRPVHLNIELKKIGNEGMCDSKPSWTAEKVSDYHPNLHKFLNILANTGEGVTTIVGSADDHIINSFRKTQHEKYQQQKYKTNLAFREQAPYIDLFEAKNIRIVGGLAPLLRWIFKIAGPFIRLFRKRKDDLSDYAFETPSAIVTADLVQEVHDKKGGIYVFLSAFPALHQPEFAEGNGVSPDFEKEVRRLIAIGVDGMMTDYPSQLAEVMAKIQSEKG